MQICHRCREDLFSPTTYSYLPSPCRRRLLAFAFSKKKCPELLSPRSKMERTTGKEWELLWLHVSKDAQDWPSTCLLERHPQSTNIHVGSNSACFKLACCSNENPWNKEELNQGPFLSSESPSHNRERESELEDIKLKWLVPAFRPFGLRCKTKRIFFFWFPLSTVLDCSSWCYSK